MSTSPSPSPPMYESKKEAARQLGVSTWSIGDLLRKKKLRAKKFGKLTQIEVASRLELVASLPDAKFAEPRQRNTKEAA
jgi:hypothetical protein